VAKDNDGIMTVAACREVQTQCSGALHSRMTGIMIDLALIKKHLGINGQYAVEPFRTRRESDGPAEEHEHQRGQDVVVGYKGDTISFPKPPKWMVLGAVGIFLLAGAGILLLIQTKTDLEQIKRFQTLNNSQASQGRQEAREDSARIERKVDAQ